MTAPARVLRVGIFTVIMPVMFARTLPLPKRTFFLFGPRGTGKTTWLRLLLGQAVWFDLLRSDVYVRLLRRPAEFRHEVEAVVPTWVVVDEVQKVPALLDEVHALMNDFGSKVRFALTGSSSRKLKKDGVNLLAGRAINRSFFPLTGRELNDDVSLDRLLRFGMLPAVHAEARSDGDRIDILEAYAANYIREEIQQEALVRNLASFTRFLDVCALMNAQVVSVASLARDAGVARQTVQGYVDVVCDTLIGLQLPAWTARPRVKQVEHPKFFWFDPGVVRALSGRLRAPLDAAERGALFETLILHELRAHIAYNNIGGALSYWRTPSGSEVDFIWSSAGRSVGIEVKVSDRYRPEYTRALAGLIEEKQLNAGFLVYGGTRPLRVGLVRVLPYASFLRALAAGEVIGL